MPVYGTFLYGVRYYGLSLFPTSVDFDIYDFCEPSDVTMLTLFTFAEMTPSRLSAPWMTFNVDNDLCMLSDDSLDSGFAIHYTVPNTTYSFQFSFLPTALPPDFSSTSDKRFFLGVFNPGGKCVGLLMSEDGGFALATSGTGAYTVFPDSADIFAEGLDYYVVRVTVNEATSRSNLYVTRKDVLAATGVHELRYTFSAPDCPAGELDSLRVEVYGTAADPTTVCLDCVRLSSHELLGNRRPVAIIGGDQARVLTQYSYFDGRASYDPDTPPQPLTHAWTITAAPDAAGARLTGVGTTPADASGYTNVIIGSPGTFAGVLEGDLLKGDLPLDSIIMRVAADGSWVALNRDAMVAGVASTPWEIITQGGWGGARLTGTTMVDVLERRADPSALIPSVGDAYLVIAPALFAWATHEGEVATWNGAGWDFELLGAGKMVFVLDVLDAYRTVGSGIWALADPKVWELDVWEGRLAQIGSYLADALGLYVVQLVVNDGVRDSLPAEALLNIYQTNVPLGLTPDLGFIWNYLSDVWGLVDDKEKVETFWSASAQCATDELMNLWQRAYSKSLLDVQRVFQRRWLNFDPWYEEPNYEELPATINNDVNAAGFADAPTPTPIPGDPLAVDPRFTYVLNSVPGVGDTITQNLPAAPTATLDDAAGAFVVDMVGRYITIAGATAPGNNGTFIITAINSSTQLEYTNANAVTVTEAFTYIAPGMPAGVAPGHHLVLEGIAYRITRIEGDRLITAQAMPVTDRPSYWMIRPTVISRESNFSLLAVQVRDSAVFEVRTEDGDIIEVPAHIWGVRGKTLVFDDDASLLLGYLASDTYTVRFKGVLRRSAIAVDDLVQNIPRLQEAIRILDANGPISGVPTPLIEGKDFRVEVVSTVEDA